MIRILATVLLIIGMTACSDSPVVQLQRVPDNGIHPRILVDSQGQTHLLYFRPDSSESRSRLGLLYYRQFDAPNQAWGPAIRVSSDRYDYGDPIYRAGFASDDDGRIHVVWYQSRPAEYFYSRSNLERSRFEPQRRIVSEHLEGIDAGADIAAQGNTVTVVWATGDLSREEERTVYLRQSLDSGTTFGPEQIIGDPSVGACACCGLAAEFDHQGNLLVAYRSAINGTGRHMQILELATASGDSQYRAMHDLRSWDLAACPVTTNDIVKDVAGDDWLVFENQSRIVAMATAEGSVPMLISETASSTREKHPAAAINIAGQRLVAWGEGAGFFSGGSLHWALFDRSGGRIDASANDVVDIPDNSSPAVMSTAADGSFIILY